MSSYTDTVLGLIRDRVFDKDGTIKGVQYYKASGRRPAVLAINIALASDKPLRTVLSIKEKDFRCVYAKVICAVADYFRVDDQELLADMHSTCDLFLTRNRLRLEPIVIRYEQVVEDDAI